MDSYFAQFDKIVKAKTKTSSRVRFMIQDVIDLRRRNWIPRRDENAPKTIDQIHKDAQKEEEVLIYEGMRMPYGLEYGLEYRLI